MFLVGIVTRPSCLFLPASKPQINGDPSRLIIKVEEGGVMKGGGGEAKRKEKEGSAGGSVAVARRVGGEIPGSLTNLI